MSTRSRRANAGNRLSLLLAEQTPLNDEDAELFAEREDDDDFDLEAEEERLRQLASGTASSDNEQGSEGAGDGSRGEDESGSESEHDDSNFSDTTDDSELENDVEPADAGEKALEKEQRMHAREQRTAERNKIFTIKRRAPKPEGPGSEQRKKRVFTSADVLLEGRHSSRKSALRNKQHLIEQMREIEERRARYVPPKRKHQPKLTQAERLEETKKTEARNLASLNKFVELEEERKLQQRLAMISRRPKLTQFVRFHSAQYLAEPKLIEIVSEKLEDETPDVKLEGSHGSAPSPAATLAVSQPSPSRAQDAGLASSDLEPPANGKDIQGRDHEALEMDNKPMAMETTAPKADAQEADAQEADAQQEAPKTKKQEVASLSGEPSSVDDEETTTNGRAIAASTASDETREEPNSRPQPPLSADTKDAVSDQVNPTPVKLVEPKDEHAADLKAENNDDAFTDDVYSVQSPVQGPAQLRTYNFLTLHEFADVSMNKYAARNIILGRIASMPAHMPLKRMCPFSGLPARYLDPATGVAYYGLETHKLLKLAKNNELGWSKELGGVFLGTTGKQRHARGVPEGFA